MEYQVKNRSELERYAQEMGLSLEETAHQIALDRYGSCSQVHNVTYGAGRTVRGRK